MFDLETATLIGISPTLATDSTTGEILAVLTLDLVHGNDQKTSRLRVAMNSQALAKLDESSALLAMQLAQYGSGWTARA